MAKERTIPSASTFIQDFGLNVTPPPAVRNKRLVVIGTAEDGPMYEPIQIDKPEDGEYIWGRLGKGDLVRGLYEAWDVQTGYPTVVGVRIGDGVNAKLELGESSGSGDDAPQASAVIALKLEAKYPGQIYNQITIGYDDNRRVAIYNPKTGKNSTFAIGTSPNNPNVDAHNVSELVDAINADTNMNSVITASFSELLSDYEVAISGTSTGVVVNDGTKVELSLEDILTNGYVVTDGFMIEAPMGTGITSTNNVIELELAEAVSISEWENLENQGLVASKFDLQPLDGKNTGRWQTIQALKDYDADDRWMNNPSGALTSEYIYALSWEQVDIGNGEGGASASGGYATNNTFRLDVGLCPDDSEETGGTSVASGYIAGLLATTYQSFTSDWTRATTQGVETKLVDDIATRPSGFIKVYASTDSDINGFWQELPYSSNSGVYLSSYSGGVATFSMGSSILAGSVSGVMRKLVDVNGRILADRYVRLVGYTVKGMVGEVETLPELEDAGSTTLSTYFVRGNEVLFNKAPDFSMIVNYGTRISYESGSNVTLSDRNEGYVTFTNPDLLPGPGGGALSNTKKTYLRFRYRYMPTFPDITSAAQNLKGGKNGSDIDNKTRYEQLAIAYDKLKNYAADLWVPMGAFIDATAIQFNPITGLQEEIPVGYHAQLEEFLDDLSINSIQPHAVLGVTPMTVVNQTSKDNWVTRLTVLDPNDPNRGANIMSQIQNKFISVVAFDPVFLNIGRGKPYAANGQATYAGFLASLPYDISPTNKEVPGIQNVRFELSISQYEALNAMRYVMMKNRAARYPVIVEDVTAAPLGSDFTNWSTFSITAEAANRVYNIAEEFLGKPGTVEVRMSLEQLISNSLISMSGLRAFDFSLTSTPTQQVLGIIEVDLILVPEFQIKHIRTTVKLRKNLPTA